ncbi:MAG: sensor domain-containing diguanylate cyclase, partial [Actinobacteria bacterium]|nr:sensor domain-containing diguanylate cyclase [Actinomycetota bacterium]
MRAPLPADEHQRLRALHDLRVLDTPADARFDAIVVRAASLCHVPMAAITLIDAERQWTKAAVGLARRDAAREAACCSHVVTGRDVVVVPDTTADPRFCDIDLVVGAPGVRFYAGAPLVSASGHAIGALCVLDRVPRSLEPWQVEVLELLARQAVSQMHLDAIEVDHAGALDDLDVARRNLTFLTSHDAMTGLANRQALLRALDDLAGANRSGTATSALLVIDIDHFRDVDDELGHDVGDRVLVTVADRIHLGCRGDDLVARLAGDQFAVLMPTAGVLGPESLARRLLHAIAAPIEFHGATVSVTASIGIARWDAAVRSGDELLRSAH